MNIKNTTNINENIGRRINIKKVVFVLLIILFIFYLSACSSSAKKDDNKSIIDQVLSMREEGNDNKANSEIEQNSSEVSNGSSTLKSDNTKTGSSLSLNDLEQLGPVGPVKRSYEEIQEQYPDKTILTIVGIAPSDFITDEINSYLIHNGTDYVVFFQSLTEEQKLISSHANDRLSSEERKKIICELLNNVDIMLIDRNNYFELARKGYFEPWNSFLSTEKGMKLYNSLPQNNWKSCDVNGEIYGINGRADFVFGPPSYIVNKDIMRKYNLSVKDLNKPIYELENILKMVAEGEKENSNFRVIALDKCVAFNLSGISLGYLDSISVSLYNNTMKNAESVLDDEEYLRWLKALWQYANKGFVGSLSNLLDDFFITIKVNTSLPYLIPIIPLYNKDKELANSNDVIEIILNDYYDSCLSWNNYSMYANVISKTSIHKDESFDFLMRVYTDPYLTNLLTYGIENRTYIMQDGKIYWPDMYYIGYGNAYISYPRSYEYSNKKELYWKLNEELSFTYYDFIFDTSNVTNEIEKTDIIMNKVSNILTGEIKDFDGFIADIRKQLNENGLNKLLNEVNRQRNEWLNSKKVAQEEMKYDD